MYKLLIADDDYAIRNGLCTYFPWNELGFDVVFQAENGREALDYILKNPVDIILCDIMMPVLSGLDLSDELVQRKIKLKIIFFSAYRDFSYAQHAIKNGVRSYIVKSTKYNELVKVFQEMKNEMDEERASYYNIAANAVKAENRADANTSGKIISTVKQYVADNFVDATLETAASLIYMNSFYLSKLFKQKTGENFSDYLIKVKMHKAAELLRNMELKTYEISELVGYSNPKNFTRAFKVFFGVSPREYRNADNAGEKIMK